MEQRLGKFFFLAHFVAHCESYAQDIETIVLVIRVSWCSFWERKKLYYYTLYFSLIIVKSLQLRGRRQTADINTVLCMWFFFSLACVFSFFVSHRFRNFVSIPYNRYQSLGLGLSGSNGKGSMKGVWNRKVWWHKLRVLEDAGWRLSLWKEIASASFREKTCNY